MSGNKWITRFVFVLFVVTGIGCSLVSGITEQIGGARSTVEAAATSVDQGMDLLGTARAALTEVGGEGLLQTAQAVATQVGDSGFLGTAQAAATQYGPAVIGTAQAVATENPGLLETARAAVTEKGPGLVETVQAAATEQGPGLIETANAIATQVASNMGDTPQDIPLIEGEKDNLFATQALVSYFTAESFEDVVNFYKEQMPANGWTQDEQSSIETQDTVILSYKKDARSAIVTLSVNPLDKKTVVMITIVAQ